MIMKTFVDQNERQNNFVKIYTDGFSINIPRNILVDSSHFFKAALQSGMSESRSGEFFLPDFTPRQLQHLQHFLNDNDLFSSKVESARSEDGCSSLSCDCQKEEQMRRLIEAVLIADYLQMPCFKYKLQTLFQQLLQSLTQPYSPCFSRSHNCETFTEMIPILSDNRLKCLKNSLLRFIYRHPLVLLSEKFVHHDISQPDSIIYVLNSLSSNSVFLFNEDDILNTTCGWIQHSIAAPKRCRLEVDRGIEVLLALLQSTRLGLLSPSGLQNLINLLDEYPEPISGDVCLSQYRSSLQILASNDYSSHFQAALVSSFTVDTPLNVASFRPRASVPTLILVARQNSPSSFIFYFLDLLTGQILSSSAPLSVERTLLFEPCESNPIHLCTAEAPPCQNLVFLFIHQINTATLKGMVWDMATLQAEWLPDLDLKHASFAWATTSFSAFSLPHAVGVVYTVDGLMVYCSFSLCTQTVLCVYRFDAASWQWVKYHPETMRRGGSNHKVLKPMPHATAQAVGERWLYGTLDSAEGSQFVRMRPAKPPGSGDYSIEIESLNSPDFVLRAYNLVSVHDGSRCIATTDDIVNSSSESTQPTNTYTFPFNACQRDSQAMRMCFSQVHNTWNSWEPTPGPSVPSPSSASSSPTTTFTPEASRDSGDGLLHFALSRNHIGFRGVVCTSSLAIPRFKHSPPTFTDTESDLDENELQLEAQSTLHPGSYLVMVGRLSQSVLPPSPKVSGLWLLDPWARRAASDAREPTFPLPADLDGLLHRATAVCGAVALANWTALKVAAGCGLQEGQRVNGGVVLSLPATPIMRFTREQGEAAAAAAAVAEEEDAGSGLPSTSSSANTLASSAMAALRQHQRSMLSSGAGSDSD